MTSHYGDGSQEKTMVVTIAEGHVTEGQAAQLEQTYANETADRSRLPIGLVESALIHSSSDASLWRIQTLWESREVLLEMRRTTAVPAAIGMFRSVGVEPTVSIFDVAATVHR
jgi:heme-degrading monooxygenase HmoA